jgi:hypothetical protein
MALLSEHVTSCRGTLFTTPAATGCTNSKVRLHVLERYSNVARVLSSLPRPIATYGPAFGVDSLVYQRLDRNYILFLSSHIHMSILYSSRASCEGYQAETNEKPVTGKAPSVRPVLLRSRTLCGEAWPTRQVQVLRRIPEYCLLPASREDSTGRSTVREDSVLPDVVRKR